MSHSDEFSQYLEGFEHPPDILCIQETFNKLPTIYSYDIVYNKPRLNRQGGGVCIYVKNGLVSHEVKVDSNSVECIACELKLRNEIIGIYNVYSTPQSVITLEDFDFIDVVKYDKLIILGDFNSHHTMWGSKIINNKGKILKQYIENNDLVLMNDGTGTRLDPHTFELSPLDLCFTSMYCMNILLLICFEYQFYFMSH